MKLAGLNLGPDDPPVFLPDIGTFFDQDIARAERLIRDIQAAGAQVCKAEILHNPDICLKGDALEHYYDPAKGHIAENYRELIERKCLSLSEYQRLLRVPRALGMPIVLSVYDFAGADFALAEGAAALKIASTNLVHAPLIRYCAALPIPLILDTGKADMAEIDRAVTWAREAGAVDLIIEHSPLPPPAPVEEQNLRMLQTLSEKYSVPVGLSDHHHGPEMLYAATALGACVLEKGVCPDDQKADQDVAHALPVSQLKSVLETCRTIRAGLGRAVRELPADFARPAARMGLITRRSVKAGDVLDLQSVDFAFPTVGIPVEAWDQAEGLRFARDLPAAAIIGWQDVETVSA